MHQAPAAVFLPIGLWLENPGDPTVWNYDSTPGAARTFASTGGDGVDFSSVPLIDREVIVMTVPMEWDRPNLVVGEDLQEFLGLGCVHGYFGLEKLVYDRTAAASQLTSPPQLSDDEASLLSTLRCKLNLTPWPDLNGRLRQLQHLAPAGGFEPKNDP